MPGIGTITTAEVFSEQVELKARTTDPASAEPGECWIRVDQTSSDPQVVAELRRQDTSGVSKIPLFADSEEANLGSEMARGPSVVLDDGSVGFVAMSSDSGAEFGSPRAVTASGTEYLSHNALELTTIPDSAIYRWPMGEGSGSTTADSIGSADGTINGASWVSGTYTDDNALDGDGDESNDYINVGQIPDFSSTTGSNFAIAYTIDNFSSGTGDFGLNTTSSGEAVTVFHGNEGPSGAPGLYLQDSSDGSVLHEVADSGPLDDGGKHRVVIEKIGNTAGDINIYVDDTQLNTTNINDNGFSSTGDFTNDFFLLGQSVDGSLNSPMDATMDDVILFNDKLSNQQITDDYDRQPWS